MLVCATTDLGPGFVAWAATIDGAPVAVVTPAAADDDVLRACVADLLREAGIECGACIECPIGLSSRRTA
jgi:hypothetical protein